MFEELDVDYEGLIIHQDRDGVYTGDRWVNRLIVKERASLSYSMDGARGNTHMESFNGHFKKPVESVFVTSETIEVLKENVKERVEYWNHDRMHETLGNRTPMEFVREER